MFVEPSPKALNTKSETWLSKYQTMFDTCPIDMSFRVDQADVALSTLRSVVSKQFNGEKHFTVIKHEDCYEVYRRK